MNLWLLSRLVKLVALMAFGAGVVGAVGLPERHTRLLMNRRYAVPGFVLLWTAGWLMAELTERSVAEPWILATMAASGVALHAAFLGSHGRAKQGRTVVPMLAFAGLLASVGLMVLRPTDAVGLAQVIAGGGVVGALLGLPYLQRSLSPDAALPADEVRRGFWWIARAEGGSLLLMVGINIPLRVATGFELDGGTGTLGFFHGALFLVYLQSLMSTAILLKWPMKLLPVAFVAALIPGGTFALEWLAPRWTGEADG